MSDDFSQEVRIQLGKRLLTDGGPMCANTLMVNLYTGEGIAPDKKSLAYTLTYRAPDRTLTAQEVEEAQKGIIAMLGERFGAELRQ